MDKGLNKRTVRVKEDSDLVDPGALWHIAFCVSHSTDQNNIGGICELQIL